MSVHVQHFQRMDCEEERKKNGLQNTTDQNRTDLSELPETSSRRDGTMRSVLTKSVCARVDEITALDLKRTSVRDWGQSTRYMGAHVRIPHLDSLFQEASKRHPFCEPWSLNPPCPTSRLSEDSRPQTRVPCRKIPGTSLVRNDPCRLVWSSQSKTRS